MWLVSNLQICRVEDGIIVYMQVNSGVTLLEM